MASVTTPFFHGLHVLSNENARLFNESRSVRTSAIGSRGSIARFDIVERNHKQR